MTELLKPPGSKKLRGDGALSVAYAAHCCRGTVAKIPVITQCSRKCAMNQCEPHKNWCLDRQVHTPAHTHYVLLGSYMSSRPVSISAPVHQDQIHVEFFISSFAPYERWQLILIPRNIKHTAELSRWKQRAPISPSTVSVPGAPVYLGPKISTHSVRSSNPLSNKKQPALNTVKEFWKGFCCPNNYFMPWTTWNI